MSKIDFTLVIPVYNSEPGALMECFYSAINQTYKEKFPILIVDDGSTDVRTLGVLEYISKHPETKVIKKRNGGVSTALNLAHEKISTEYIALLGSEDLFHKQKIELQAAHLSKNPHIDVLSTQLYTFSHEDFFRKPGHTTKHPLICTTKSCGGHWKANHGTVIYKNEAVKKVGGYNETKRRGQDIDLWSRMGDDQFTFQCLQEVLYGWRRFAPNG